MGENPQFCIQSFFDSSVQINDTAIPNMVIYEIIWEIKPYKKDQVLQGYESDLAVLDSVTQLPCMKLNYLVIDGEILFYERRRKTKSIDQVSGIELTEEGVLTPCHQVSSLIELHELERQTRYTEIMIFNLKIILIHLTHTTTSTVSPTTFVTKTDESWGSEGAVLDSGRITSSIQGKNNVGWRMSLV